jgi:ectoine hydroxylase-related dioxygenase (phytanoyl-CoA dioxygenase family)
MAGAIRLLHANRLPPVFAFHFDEFWLVLAQLRRVIATILGDGYVMLPDFWAWHVDPMTADSGWPPHRDKGRRALFPDGRPQSLTLWLPLTDATPINGCIYVVPADRDPTYNTAAEESLQFTLSDIRALPAAAGSILAWTQAIIHWGGHAASRDAPPRISLSCEFQRGDVAPFNSPLLPPAAMPDFATRHSLIGRQVLRYRQMEPLDGALESCAAAMASFGRNRCEPVGA